MYKHIIPVNMMDNGNILNGMLKKRNCFEAGIYAAFIILVLYTLKMFLSIKIILIFGVIFLAGPVVFLVIGLGDESVGEAIISYIKYKKQKKLLRYSLAMCLKEKEPEKKRKKTKEDIAEEKARKKVEKEKRKKERSEKKQKKAKVDKKRRKKKK